MLKVLKSYVIVSKNSIVILFCLLICYIVFYCLGDIKLGRIYVINNKEYEEMFGYVYWLDNI